MRSSGRAGCPTYPFRGTIWGSIGTRCPIEFYHARTVSRFLSRIVRAVSACQCGLLSAYRPMGGMAGGSGFSLRSSRSDACQGSHLQGADERGLAGRRCLFRSSGSDCSAGCARDEPPEVCPAVPADSGSTGERPGKNRITPLLRGITRKALRDSVFSGAFLVEFPTRGNGQVPTASGGQNERR